MISTKQLNEVFRFKHQKPSSQQDEANCRSFVSHLCALVSTIKPIELSQNMFSRRDPHVDDRVLPVGKFTVSELEQLKRVCCQLGGDQDPKQQRGDKWVQQWLPAYGCALEVERVSVACIELCLILPDGWQMELHSLPNGAMVHSAVPTTVKVLHCGRVHAGLLVPLLEDFHKRLADAQTRSGDKRNASSNEEGHQKTPQFIAALLMKARVAVLNESDEDIAPRGGTTDVGLHTGGSARDTCWPLVRAVAERSLPAFGALAKKLFLHFQLALLEAELSNLESLPSDSDADRKILWACAEVIFEMLTKIVLELIQMLENGYDILLVKDDCESKRTRLGAVVEKANRVHAAQFVLLDEHIASLSSKPSCPKLLDEPEFMDPYQLASASATSEAQLKMNLGYCELIDGSTCSSSDLLRWLSYIDTAEVDGKIMLVLSTVEEFMLGASRLLVSGAKNSDTLLSVSDVDTIVHFYIEYIGQWHGQPLSEKLRIIEQQSHELLVLWIAFCIVHQRCDQSCTFIKNYGVALDWARLEVLVLSEQKAVDSMINVVKYIRTWNQRNKPPLFHLSNQTPTFQFGLAVAQSTVKYATRRLHEKHLEREKVAEHWRAVRVKKREAIRVRAEIRSLESALESKNEDLCRERLELTTYNSHISSYHRKYTTPGIDQCNSRIRQLTEELTSSQNNLKAVLKMPRCIESPLPQETEAALTTLFFLEMPEDIGVLAQLCLSAQRRLGPCEMTEDLQQKVAGHSCKSSWLNIYNGHSYSTEQFSEQAITAFPPMFSVPRQHGPTSVDEIESEDEVARQCVWYPGFSGTSFLWTDVSGLSINPFKISRDISIEVFTEHLPKQFEVLQWAVSYPGGNLRGNLVYSMLDEQPVDDFDRSSYLTFGSLRAFPYQQIRKLCCALKDNRLPWSNPCVVTLVRQALFQIGDLTDEDTSRLPWKTDITSKEGLEVFFQSLDQMAAAIEQTPREYECVPLLAELAGFLSQHKTEVRSIVKRFVGAARRWAVDAQHERRSGKFAGLCEELRVKECLMYGYAICCYRLGPVDNADLAEICELVVLFTNAKMFISKNACLDRLQLEVNAVIQKRIVSIVDFVSQNGTDVVLTRLLRLVNPSAPSNLSWTQINTSSSEDISSCYRAHDPVRDVSYAINLLNGYVLTDGCCSGRLPLTIRKHSKYKELFDEYDFEVSAVKGVYRTNNEFGGWYFDIFMVNGELLVQKVDDCQQAKTTLQLCRSSWVQKIDQVLPLRLRELYSHWYWVEKHCVLFLPKRAVENEVSFAIAYEDHNSAKCYQIPGNIRNQSYERLAKHIMNCDFIISDHTMEIVRVLSKFESEQFIQIRQSPNGKIVFELPRFRLSFWINDCSKLESTEYKGYVLSADQHLVGVFPRFQRYLVLHSSDFSDTRTQLRLLVPEGIVFDNVLVDIDISTSASAGLHVVVYDEHLRLKSFQAESISARLQLAALYASTGTSIPDPKLCMTGIEAALQILRQCRSSRPYTPVEQNFLVNMCSFCFREPAMKLMLSMLVENSQRLSFLMGEHEKLNLRMDCHYEQDEYSNMCNLHPTRNSWRVRLRDAEELFCFGSTQGQKHSFCVCGKEFVDLERIPVKASCVQDVEILLSQLMSVVTSTGRSCQFPLRKKQKNAMRNDMDEELHQSWDAYHSQDIMTVEASATATLSNYAASYLSDISSERKKMEDYLHHSILRARDDICSQLLVSINYVASLTVQDILRSAIDEHVLLELAPRLSISARLTFRQAVLLYMELCVLEDKLRRLAYRAAVSWHVPKSYFNEELSNIRTWSTADYPYWLVFEVEGHIQIRQEQFLTAKHLIDNPGIVCQMNMGRGKTRVILPMLFLHFNQHSSQIVRGHFLTPLLSETRQFMHRYLSAGIAELNFFELPFHRKIELDIEKLRLMNEALEETKRCGGFLIVAPEHRLSLELNRRQLSECQDDELSDVIQWLDAVLEKGQYIDIMDECDAILHHKYHLVYAMGIPQKLENGPHRWVAAQSLLCAISDNQSSRIIEISQSPNVCSRQPEYSSRIGAFNGLRLATNLDGEAEFRAQLREAIANDLIDHPPFELAWLGALGKIARNHLIEALTNPRASIDRLFEHVGSDCFRNELLALRGLIAFGIMEHCLEKRHRVDYGLPEQESRPKMLAIPFRAADIPSERSEFSHPDVGIVLTLLAYYHSGLRESEIKQTFRLLLNLDVSEQETHYSAWYKSVKDRLSVDEQTMLSSVEFISLDDPRTLSVLCRVYKYAMEVINFYLRMSVFPRDTTQYPQRISRSAWNLTTGDMNIGFSGTNDNHRLLPSAVTQLEPNEPSLRGTNGKMVDLILKVCQGYEVISQDDNSVIAWEALLNMALAKKSHALIDTGAILAGVFNHDAALFLLKQDEFSYSGVTYYDTRPDWDCWVVLEREQRVITPLKKSSTLEKDTFVIFDEARSRGSDMKLYPHAKAVLTLGPRLTKDKLMQGAGRMRQLGCDQSLWIMSMNEVAQSILKSSELCDMKQVTAIDILNWIMDNTRSEAIHGLLEWASSGLHFNRTQINPNAELVDEDWSLKALYEAPQNPELIVDIIHSRVRQLYGDTVIMDDIVAKICEKALLFGAEDEVFVASHTGECEREFQVEKVLQLEENVTEKNCSPRREEQWDYARVLSVTSAKTLPASVVETQPLDAFVKNAFKPEALSQILWSSAKVVGTVNFFSTIAVPPSDRAALNEFARVIDAFLLFPDNSVLLLSEFEADHMLKLFWKLDLSASCRFMNLSYSVDTINGCGKAVNVPRSLGCRQLSLVPVLPVAVCCLFNGNVKFGSHQEDVVRTLLHPLSQREATLQEFVSLRGYGYTWARSFLHDLCHVMDFDNFTHKAGSA